MINRNIFQTVSRKSSSHKPKSKPKRTGTHRIDPKYVGLINGPGAATVIYFHLVNGTITSLDAGVSTSVGIFAGKAGAPQSVTVEGR